MDVSHTTGIYPAPTDLLSSILPSARATAILFGLLKQERNETRYHQTGFGVHSVTITKRVLPNRFARLDIIYLDEQPAGTIVSIALTDGLLHMSGMYVREEFRSKKIFQTLNMVSDDFARGCTPLSEVLLEALVRDLVAEGLQMTLEVMNNNKRAWELYEKRFRVDPESSIEHGFELMTREDIQHYARLRGKHIKRWHPVDGGTEGKTGVQWEHVPDFNNSYTWSITRVYLLSFGRRESEIGHPRRVLNAIRASLTVLRYGNLIGFVRHQLVKAFAK